MRSSTTPSADNLLRHLSAVLQSRKPNHGGDPATSYVAGLLSAEKAPDAFLKKIGEEAAEVILAAKDLQAGSQNTQALVSEVADLWFHTLVALTHFDLHANDVVQELARREGLSGLTEKAAREKK